MKPEGMNTAVMRAFVWSGVALIAAMIFAQGWLMGFLPPPSPNLSAEDTAKLFIDNKDNIRLGTLIQCIFWSFWNTWGIAVVVFIRKMEKGIPVLTYASIANVGGGFVFFILIPMTWGVIAFRPETLDPKIIQIMNDWVWFNWLFTWPPFAVWMVIIALAVFGDYNTPRVFPRWVGFFNLWCALLIFPAGLIVFFKTGPFAYDGLISFWFAFAVFFSWMVVMTVLTLQAITTEQRRLERGTVAG